MERAQRKVSVKLLVFENFYFDYYSYRFGLWLGLGLVLFYDFMSVYMQCAPRLTPFRITGTACQPTTRGAETQGRYIPQ